MFQVLFLLLFILQISISSCGRTCLSCSDVGSVHECSDVEVCADDEVCYTNRYTTRDMVVSYDFGCSFHQFCTSIIGKRRAGHHLVCQTCCNTTNICNIQSSCVNGSKCSSSSTCPSYTCPSSTCPSPTVIQPDKKLPRECDDLSYSSSGVYTVYPDGINAVRVYCIMAHNEKWTVIQKRFNGYLSFDRTWEEYKSGFGSVSEEYWLGNDNIHQISKTTSHKLSIYIEDFTGSYKYANYSHFSFGDEFRKYQLRIDGVKLTTGLSGQFTASHYTYLFTTKDQNNDSHNSLNCAVKQGGNGGWWYNNCGYVNLNGPYMAGPVNNLTGMIWYGWPSQYYSLKKSTMMIKRYHE